MNKCVIHPNWIEGCLKSKNTHQKLKQQRIKNYYKDPKLCLKCNFIRKEIK